MITNLEDFRTNVINQNDYIQFGDDSIAIINVDELYTSGYSLVDIIFYLRIVGIPSESGLTEPVCKPIICSGFSPAEYLISKDPQYAILYSPGVSYVQQPYENAAIKKLVNKFPELDETQYKESLKPFLKLRVDELIGEFRHSYSNYTGMLFYLFYTFRGENKEGIREKVNHHFPGVLSDYLGSIEFEIFAFYFGLSSHWEIERLYTIDEALLRKKKVLLIDDLAKDGWAKIISDAVFGMLVDPRKRLKDIPRPESEKTWEETVKNSIDEHKPHLILLDLRLSGEKGHQDLEKLQGYKILQFLKEDEVYSGIPVIVFTASANAENMKRLIETGAEAVWTKPGLDESLQSGQIIIRFNNLKKLIEASFRKFQDLLILQNGFYSFEDLRVELYKKLQYINYRIKLDRGSTAENYFSDFTDIFIDTNLLMTGSFLNAEDDKRFTRTLCNIFLLSKISTKTKHTFDIAINSNISFEVSKVIIHNAVLDELINHSKKYDQNLKSKWKRALLGYDIIRGLFENMIVRTEFNKVVRSTQLLHEQKNIQTPDYADPILAKEINYILSNESFKINNIKIRYRTENAKVLLLTDDKELIRKTSMQFYGKAFYTMNISQFNKAMDSLLI